MSAVTKYIPGKPLDKQIFPDPSTRLVKSSLNVNGVVLSILQRNIAVRVEVNGGSYSLERSVFSVTDSEGNSKGVNLGPFELETLVWQTYLKTVGRG